MAVRYLILRWRGRGLALGLLLALLAAPTLAAPRIATLDWALGETLLGMGITPLAMANTGVYNAWVGEPAAPKAVHDIGLRAQPNLELLSRLAPDAIVMSPRFGSLVPRLERIAPVHQLSLYNTEDAIWPTLLTMTRRLGDISDAPAAAQALIDDSRALLASWRQRLAPYRDTPLLIVQFIDDRHLRVFGDGGLFQAALDRLDLTNAWQGETNAYGFATIDLETLAELDARVMIVEPLPAPVAARLADSGLWQWLESHRDAGFQRLPPIWAFGALPSLQRFTNQLGQALLERPPVPQAKEATDE